MILRRKAAERVERIECQEKEWRHWGSGGAPPEGYFPPVADGHLLGVNQVMWASMALKGVSVAARTIEASAELSQGSAALFSKAAPTAAAAAATLAQTPAGQQVLHELEGEAIPIPIVE